MEFPNVENWIKATCPGCKTDNWIWLSVRNEATPDIEAFKCFNCGNCFWLDEGSQELASEFEGVTDPAEAQGLEDGLKIPK